MSQPDIFSQMTTVVGTDTDTGANVDVNEPSSVTVAPDGNKGQDKGVQVPEQSDKAEQQAEVQGDKEAESKSKEERKAEGKRVERKINGLYKDKAEALERAARAEAELATYKKLMEEREQKNSQIDLDALSFDERVAHVASNKVEDQLLSQRVQQSQAELEQVRQYEWEHKRQEAEALYPDYAEKVQAAAPLFESLPPMIQEAIVNSENGAKVAYQIANNPELALRLSRANPVEAAVHLLRIEQSVSSNANLGLQPVETQGNAAPVQAVPRVSATPIPAKVGNGPVLNHWELPMEDFMALGNNRRRR